jgi:hypothetical protein
MRRLFPLACAILLFAAHSWAQDAPATAPGAAETLSHGQVLYTPPADWKLIGKSKDDRHIGFALEGNRGQLVIAIAPQPQAVTATERAKLSELLTAKLTNTIKGEATKGNIEIIKEPTTESDPRYLVKMHDRFRAKGLHADRVQLVRDMGRFILTVVSTAFTEDEAEMKQVHAAGEQLMWSMKQNKPDSPAPTAREGELAKSVVFAEPKLRVSPPAGWKAEPTRGASGLIVVWRDPTDSSNLITLTYRPIPADAKKDPSLRDVAIDRIASGEKPTFQMEGAQLVGQTQTVPDKRFIRKTRADYKSKDVQFRVGFRQVRAGDGVVSITSVALHDKAEVIDALADKVAAEVRTTAIGG